MKILLNNTQSTFQHTFNDKIISIEPKEKKEVPNEVADVWLKYEGVDLVSDLNEIEEKNTEIAELKKELAKTKTKKKK